MATAAMKGAAATQRRQWKARRQKRKARWQQQRRDVNATATAGGGDNTKFLESNADALRSAAFAFAVNASSLEVSSLSLTK